MNSYSPPFCYLCNKNIHPRDLVDTRNGYFWHAQCKEDARSCDCCDKMVHRDEICRVDFSGLETWACDECRDGRSVPVGAA
jgi:hypothetical protein